MTFATRSALAEFTGDTSLDSARGDLLLEMAASVIRNHARQTFTLVEGDEVELRGTWSPRLQLPERPVVDVAGAAINGHEVDYDQVRDRLIRRDWGGPSAVVTVTYTHGFAEIPDDIKAICLSVAARTAANPADLATFNADGVNLGFRTGLLRSDEAALLDRYRHEMAS